MRSVFFQVLTLVVIGLVISVSWKRPHAAPEAKPVAPAPEAANGNAAGEGVPVTVAPAGSGPEVVEKDDSPADTELAASPHFDHIENRALEIQAKIAVGISQWIKHAAEQAKTPDSAKLGRSTIESFLNTAPQSAEATSGARAKLGLVRLKLLMIAKYLGYPDLITPEELSALESSGINNLPGSATYRLAQNILRGDAPELDAAQKESFRASLGWFGDLAVATNEHDVQLRAQMDEKIAASAKKAATAFFCLMIAGVFSVLGLLILTYKLLRGRLQFMFPLPTSMPAAYGLEIFCFYLLWMFGLSKGLGYLAQSGVRFNMLLANVVGITSSVVLILWPLLWRQSFRSVRSFLGFRVLSFRKFIADIFAGPFTYVSAWALLLPVLVIYMLVLQSYGISADKGEHPVVPILLSNKKGEDATMWIVLLAVFVAPFIEEIMFRGALYGWLRARAGAALSILSSSLIFAFLHPQGAVGIVPLTAIGMVLAFLREWRGTLVAPMVAHACFNAGTLLLVINLFR